MLCVYNEHTNPYFNLAAEEYFFNEYEDDVFRLWRNAATIVVGKHQNTNAEINVDYVKKKGIKVVRRLSGGGAVFQDLGNICYTFIATRTEDVNIDFERYTRPVIEVLQELGVDARFEGRNDITISGKKFSGNAQYIRKNRVMHHGTILFSSRMTDLSEALKVNPLKYKDKAVKSVRSRVTNISEHLSEPMDVTTFIEMLMDHILANEEGAVRHDLSDRDLAGIEALMQEKYATRDWNVGYSPEYAFHHITRTPGGNLEIMMDVQDGLIKDVKIYGDFFSKRDIGDIENAVRGVSHEVDVIKEALKTYPIGDYFANVTLDDLVGAMF